MFRRQESIFLRKIILKTIKDRYDRYTIIMFLKYS